MPYSNIKKLAWSLIVTLVTIYAAIVIPMDLAFELQTSSTSFWLIGIVFFIDLIFNASLLYKQKVKQQCIEMHDEMWFKKVLLSIDLIAAIPFDLIFPIPIFKLFRLLKLIRTYDTIKNFQRNLVIHSSSYSLLTLLFWFILGIHALLCGWHSLQIHEHGNSFATDYINSLYWTVTTITTVGYGDITPINNAQKLYAIFVQILGFGVLTFVIGTVASRIIQKDPATARYEKNVESLASLMHYRSIPTHLKMRILNFYKYLWKKRAGYDESTFLMSLPENLQTEVALHLKKEVIEKVSIFSNASANFKKEIALRLKPIFLTPSDYIFKTGYQANEMFFVVNGELHTLTQDEDRVLTELKAGDFFGEIALFKNKTRTATVKAQSYCDIYSLDKISFDKVISKYPDIGEKIRATVEEREKQYSVG